MSMRILRYIYKYGIVALLKRCFLNDFKPCRMGWGYLFRHCVHRVGTLWAIPTLKSFRVWRMLRRARKIRIFLTLPERFNGGAVYYLDQQIAGFEYGVISIVVSPAGFMSYLTVRVYDGSKMTARFYIERLSSLRWLPRHLVEDIVVSTIVAWHNSSLA